MLTLHVVTASTRDGRKGRGVAEWFLTQARAHGKFAIEDVDLAVSNLPMFESVTIPFFMQHFTADTGAFDPGEIQTKAAVAVLDELLNWANALKPLRAV